MFAWVRVVRPLYSEADSDEKRGSSTPPTHGGGDVVEIPPPADTS